MQYYLLNIDHSDLTRITISEYFAFVATHKLGNNILVLYNPADGTVSSMKDISPYWFHDFNGKLDEFNKINHQ